MATEGSAFLEHLDACIARLKGLTHISYQQSDIRDVLSSFGTRSELFLKSILLPAKSPRGTFNEFIDALPDGWLSDSSRADLRKLREKYNKAKHDPSFHIDLIPALEVMTAAVAAFRHMVAAGVGRSIEAKTNGVRRVYWISACDHYTSGETEVHIHIPGVSEHWLGVPSFDMVNVAGREWDDVKAELAAIGTLRQAESIIPPEQIKAFRSDEDSLMPLVFEGVYKDLLMVLSSHERRVEGLLPFLRRDYDERRILIAILMAAIDIASGAGDMVALSKRIESQVTGQYGVPEDYPNLAMLVGEFVTLFKEVPPAHWARVHGPVWARNETYEKSASAAVASHPRWPLVLSAELSIVMKWDHS